MSLGNTLNISICELSTVIIRKSSLKSFNRTNVIDLVTNFIEIINQNDSPLVNIKACIDCFGGLGLIEDSDVFPYELKSKCTDEILKLIEKSNNIMIKNSAIHSAINNTKDDVKKDSIYDTKYDALDIADSKDYGVVHDIATSTVTDEIELIENVDLYFSSFIELHSSDDKELLNIFNNNNSIIRLKDGLKTFNCLISKHVHDINEQDKEKYLESVDNLKEFIKYKKN